MTVKAALNNRERTHQIYMKNSEFMKAQPLVGLTGTACHLLGGQEQMGAGEWEDHQPMRWGFLF